MQKWETKCIVLPLDIDTDTSGTRGSMAITLNYSNLFRLRWIDLQ